MRNSIAPVIGAAIYSNRLNERQQYHLSVLSEKMAATDPLASQYLAQHLIAANASGKGSRESEQFSSMVLKGKVAVQATIVAMKEITGNTVILILITAGITYILPYRKNETT